MLLQHLLTPAVLGVLGDAVAFFTALAFLYGSAKILWTRFTGRPFPVNAVTRKLDAVVELGLNVIGFLNKLRSPTGAPLIANPDVQRRDQLIDEMRVAMEDLERRLADALAERPTPRLLASPSGDAMRVLVGAAGVSLVGPAGASPVVDAAPAPDATAFDASKRQTIAPEVVEVARALTGAEKGAARVGVLLAIAALLIVGAVVAVLAAAVRG